MKDVMEGNFHSYSAVANQNVVAYCISDEGITNLMKVSGTLLQKIVKVSEIRECRIQNRISDLLDQGQNKEAFSAKKELIERENLFKISKMQNSHNSSSDQIKNFKSYHMKSNQIVLSHKETISKLHSFNINKKVNNSNIPYSLMPKNTGIKKKSNSSKSKKIEIHKIFSRHKSDGLLVFDSDLLKTIFTQNHPNNKPNRTEISEISISNQRKIISSRHNQFRMNPTSSSVNRNLYLKSDRSESNKNK